MKSFLVDVKKELDGITIEVMDYLVLVTYNENKNFSKDFLAKTKDLVKIAFPDFEVQFIKKV